MIKQTNKITGKLNASIIHVYPELENIEITPAVEDQEFKSDMYGYDKVRVKGVQSYIDEDIKPEYIKDGVDILGVVGNVVELQGEERTVTPSIQEQVVVPSEDKNGITKLTIQPVDNTIDEDIKPENIVEGVEILGVVGSYKGVDSSDATATSEDILAGKTAYANNEKIEGTIQEYDGSYSGNTSEGLKITNTQYLFYGNSRNNCINELLRMCKDTTVTSDMFYNCSEITDLDLNDLDTSNVRNASSMLSGCTNLTNLNMSNCDFGKLIHVQSMFYNCKLLTNFKSFKNLGKGYKMERNNYSSYRLDLSDCTDLTYESLIDVITNGLYDLNLTYDVSNGGTLYRQGLVLGSTNMAKLTADEIAIATNKGWDVT